MEKDSEIYRGKKERVKSIALKAKKESSDDETLTSKSENEEERVNLLGNQEKKRSHSDKEMGKKGKKSDEHGGNVLVRVIQTPFIV
ncbi:hypothetical protein Tco_0539618 [Tanacetum coccineum]